MDHSEINSDISMLRTTSDGSLTLVHHEHGETYHSDLGATTEALELYIGRSGISEALSSGASIRVLDVGLGLGYNAVATISSWMRQDSAGDLFLLSLEINLDLIRQMSTAKALWQTAWPNDWLAICSKIREVSHGHWSAKFQHPNNRSELIWQIIGGDALGLGWTEFCQKLPFDFIWQDAFSPKNCPQLWQAEWFQALRLVAAPNCMMMTYSVARLVRDQMQAAGWSAQRIPGSGKKKHWLRATPNPRPQC